MALTELGLDRWLEEQASRFCVAGQRLARVTVVDRGRYVVRDKQGEVSAELTGKFLYTAVNNRETIGDRPRFLFAYSA